MAFLTFVHAGMPLFADAAAAICSSSRIRLGGTRLFSSLFSFSHVRVLYCSHVLVVMYQVLVRTRYLHSTKAENCSFPWITYPAAVQGQVLVRSTVQYRYCTRT